MSRDIIILTLFIDVKSNRRSARTYLITLVIGRHRRDRAESDREANYAQDSHPSNFGFIKKSDLSAATFVRGASRTNGLFSLSLSLPSRVLGVSTVWYDHTRANRCYYGSSRSIIVVRSSFFFYRREEKRKKGERKQDE